jgi:predicted 2-oxoglutarate/Fe(II)-dependent dioxygenase YbiX
MPHSNPQNPINWPEVLNPEVIAQLNEQHADMPRYINQGTDSTALAQVRQAQYADAVSNLNRAVNRVMELQERALELAYQEMPHEGLDRELDLLGL